MDIDATVALPGQKRTSRQHTGKVVMLRSNLRWCSDGLEFSCWNGEVVRAAFLIDAHDREIISWRAVANAGISARMSEICCWKLWSSVLEHIRLHMR